jgi:PiT family inorganic phosphate transporter
MKADAAIGALTKNELLKVTPEQAKKLKSGKGALLRASDYAPLWVMVLIAVCLGVGTTVGWRRIVVTVGEKIGKAHLTYGQGAAAETVAASTIALAGWLGMPVSTTHVLSSGIAGTMVAQSAGIQTETVRKIGAAWLLTLPATMLLSAVLFWLLRLVLPA